MKNSSIKKLFPIYQYKQQILAKQQSEKRRQILEIEVEIKQRKSRIENLNDQVRNSRLIQAETENCPGHSVDSRFLVAVDKYINVMAYEIEKEEFYLEMTFGELDAANEELMEINNRLLKNKKKASHFKTLFDKETNRQNYVISENELEDFSSRLRGN